jgi:hypothetical protein
MYDFKPQRNSIAATLGISQIIYLINGQLVVMPDTKRMQWGGPPAPIDTSPLSGIRLSLEAGIPSTVTGYVCQRY